MDKPKPISIAPETGAPPRNKLVIFSDRNGVWLGVRDSFVDISVSRMYVLGATAEPRPVSEIKNWFAWNTLADFLLDSNNELKKEQTTK